MMTSGRIAVLLVLGLGCLSGCKPVKVTAQPDAPSTNETLAATPRGRQGIELLTVMIPEQNGLDALIEQNSQAIRSDEAGSRLASEAILVRILREEDLMEVLSTLEGRGAAQNIWCGQMLEWRDLLEQRTKNQLMRLDEDLLLFNEGRLTIGARGWIEPSIEGVRTRVELVPRHLPDRPETPSLIRSNKVVPRFFETASVQTELAPGEILMITCSAPLPSTWEDGSGGVENEDAGTSLPETEPSDSEPITPSIDRPSPTMKGKKPAERLGHIMFMTPALSSERSSQRTALLLIPRIPRGMLPQRNVTTTPMQDDR